MFTKIKTSQHSLSGWHFRRFSGAASLAALSLFLLAGCGGGGGSNGNSGGGGSTGTGTTGTGTSGTGTGTTGGTNSPYIGSYQGVYLNTSGPSSPDAGTVAFTVAANGAVSGSDLDFTGDGSTNKFTGTISSSGALVTNSATGTLSQNSTTHVFSTSLTEPNGTKAMVNVGLAPTTSPLAGSYSGTFSSSGGDQGTITMIIGSGGAITATATQAGKTATLPGYVDVNGTAYLPFVAGGVPTNAVGGFTLTGTTLSGTLQDSSSDGSKATYTFSLTKK